MKRAALIFLIALITAALAFAEDKAVCAVCGPREGAGFEPVKATATYQGKQYFFCSLKCKVEFLKNPAEFLKTTEGAAAAEFELEDLAGRTMRLSDFRGKVVLLDFWATFCRPCLNALPELQSLQERYGGRGLRVVGISVDERDALVRKAVRRAGVTYPILGGSSEVWNAYKVNALPTLILVGRDGRVVRRFGGEADRQLMIRAIEQALEQ